MIIDQKDGVVRIVDSKFYAVKKNSKVTLTVEVGDSQAGGTSYTWGEDSEVGDPNFEDKLVNGAGEGIDGTVLHCLTKVVDIRPETNHTSVTYTLKGGVKEQSFPYAAQVLQEHGLAKYFISFIFTAGA
jgi:hypothetical protein